jgi:hypothetical protein
MGDKKRIVIIGGGTIAHASCHLSIGATAYGKTARRLDEICQFRFNGDDVNADPGKADSIMEVWTYLTRMAGGPTMGLARKEMLRKHPDAKPTFGNIADFRPTHLETNDDVDKLVDEIIADDTTRIVFFNVAMCDWIPANPDAGKYAQRLKTKEHDKLTLELKPAPKIINKIRATRKDIFLVGWKTTTNATEDEQYLAALDLCKRASCNLVMANDTVTRMNMVVTPEEARYHVTDDRERALVGLVDMTFHRTHLNFTRSTVIAGDPVPWTDDRVPPSLRAVVNYCIQQHAYKPFNGVTAGHFACKLDDLEVTHVTQF